jgi:hypothetical protein
MYKRRRQRGFSVIEATVTRFGKVRFLQTASCSSPRRSEPLAGPRAQAIEIQFMMKDELPEEAFRRLRKARRDVRDRSMLSKKAVFSAQWSLE